MFKQGRHAETTLVICVILSITLLIAERSNQYTNLIKGQLSVIFTPVYYMAHVPSEFILNMKERLVSHKELLEENKRLSLEKLQLKGMLQKFTALKQENQRLRLMLKSSEKVSDKLLVAELLHATNEPGTQQFVLNQGSNQSVYVGQAVIDANGIIGQVLNVNKFNSRVLLITDIEHAIPVEILRNNYRAIAVGMGNKEYLELTNVPNTTDIIIGDMLVTSGLGKRFPSGYPVGKVIFIDKNPALPFAKIIVEPMAKINQVREVLLIWPGSKVSFNKDQDTVGDESLSTLNNKNNETKSAVNNLNKVIKKSKIDTVQSEPTTQFSERTATFKTELNFQNAIQDDVEEVRVNINNSSIDGT